MSQKSITIVGAGIAGLTLARCLHHRGIHATILDKVTALPNYSYAITLYPRAYKPLLKILDVDEVTFRNQVAVDGTMGGTGCLQPEDSPSRPGHVGAFRAHRAKFEALLREGLDVKLGYSLSNAELTSQDVELSFENKQSLHSDLVIGADGVHSQIRRLFIPTSIPTILPFVVFNGKRQITESVYQNVYVPFMKNTTILETRKGNTLLQISISERTSGRTRISYTYSRPARDQDELYKPGRAVTGATDIPEAFYDEVGQLKQSEGPFADIFDAQKMRGDRILHWLMRTTTVDLDDLHRLAQKRVILIGDAVHGQPILGGKGANAAVIDGIDLAERIAANESASLAEFCKSHYKEWKQEVERSVVALEGMHSAQNPGDNVKGGQSLL